MTGRVAVVGATGFVGGHVAQALRGRGVEVLAVSAPRVRTSARTVEALVAASGTDDALRHVAHLREQFVGCTAVVNAAGVASATSDGDGLFGANALLPALVARAAGADARVVHVSSAAVQGRREPLDESTETYPFSPYSHSKSLGEQAVRDARPDAVCFRPTSVHGPSREVTQRLHRVVSSRWASVAGAGSGPSPQVLVENVADAIAFVATTADEPPGVVLQPSEGVSVASLIRDFGGREPRHVPLWLAHAAVSSAFAAGRVVPQLAGTARRVEMLWFGQGQDAGWLTGRWTAPAGPQRWKDMW